ncbi:hypothetical protein GE21DRAFT_8827 [Neurospora crassa]|uniref:DUF2461 domain-containing protein n=1 Tax=Neurospora crassa (strain ATCC 24698 / 74-OR23-1A / CBS 708.71 / DSM 1257 / FGSC 987) TaxID=367110 RepID=Q7S6J1_NEUCR|nr:hypothetical protein NCU04844 [Neurospora crassa OR74A]EAA31167.1 hypothetical protein NCU04844 [Neurospora crassa OR74A]KHE89045.1 hypothetical protein GE21DRAFT_8827 [Neurospora crassa]|eukprot:XP_960403.1 hypothetical protein NCU04844 [Neurospora crassa OR74A]
MPPRKRKAAAIAHDDDAVSTPDDSSRRRSTRVSASAKKSHYFESGDSDSDSPEASAAANAKSKAKATRGRPKKAKVEADPGLDEDEDAYNNDSETQNDDDDDDNDDNNQNNNNNDDDDEASDDSSSSSPNLTFIPIPKLRDLNGVPYTPTTIHPNTLLFLADLRRNNKRSWLKLHDAEYRRSLSDWESYATSLTDEIISSCDATIPELPFRDINFRIYRDIRFSKDPTPYKPHYSASWSRTGRKGPYACYYVHVEPGKCFVGGGLWHPDGPALAKLRASVDERPGRWRRVLMDKTFRETFLEKGGKESVIYGRKKKQEEKKKKKMATKKGRGKKDEDEEEEEEDDEEEQDGAGLDEERAVIKAFCVANAENALKTKPKGFDAEHRDIELLKLRNFTVGKKLPDSVFTSKDGQEQVLDVIRAMVPFVTHLNRIVMPDPGDDDDSEEEEV